MNTNNVINNQELKDVFDCIDNSSYQVNEQTTDRNILTLNRNVNGIWKLGEKTDKNQVKNLVIRQLKKYNYRTNFNKIASCLIDIFGISENYPSHWHYMASHYTPKTINSVLNQMVKIRQNGATPLKNPGAYFTKVIKRYHKPRKMFRHTIRIGKQQNYAK